MIELDLLRFKEELKFKNEGPKRFIFDLVRQKWLVAGPEEFVRQLFILYLIQEKDYSAGRIGIERGLKVNKMEKRCDILVYNAAMSPFLLVECKAPKVKITDRVFRQIAQYNMPLKVPYLIVTNGMTTYCCEMDYEQKDWTFLPEIPFNERN